MKVQLTNEGLNTPSVDVAPTDIGTKATVEIGTELQVLLADVDLEVQNDAVGSGKFCNAPWQRLT